LSNLIRNYINETNDIIKFEAIGLEGDS